MGFEIPRFSNPPRKDRFNNMNGRLAHDLIEIDPSCVKLIKDLSFYVEADQAKTPMLGHISDSASYAEWYTFPINIRGIKAAIGNGVTLL
jgi:hypothetical protein